MTQHDDIAIVGVGCRFPGADDLDEFWRVLSRGENHVREIPRDRWNLETVYDEDPNATRKTNVRQAGFVKDYHEWDHRFYGINELEAGEVDPQQRMVLDCVHMALEDAGIRRQDLDGSYTGVYIGSMNDDFKSQSITCPENFGAYTVTGLHSSIISARVAYVYNLHGPAVTMDTACSSSLVAINVAEQALRLGTCDAAICGGTNSILDAAQFVALSKARMLSPTGQSKPFSAHADGYARGEGCGIVVLKRLKDAIRDDNKIWGIVATGCNQDGSTNTPITAPSGGAQVDLLQRLYERSNVDKHSVQVIEAHGTGTPVGDPIETNALGKFFGSKDVSKQRTLIGSVKSNIGHTEAAAGVAGLTKVLLMMKYGQIVPSLILPENASINPKIKFDQYGFEVPIEETDWPRPSKGGRVACVNSFGFGGTNAHAIVHEYINPAHVKSVTVTQPCEFPPFITLSALGEPSLADQVKDFSKRLKDGDYDMCSLSHTSTSRRDHRSFRKAFVADNKQSLIEQCERYIETPTSQSRFGQPTVVFVFCGVGTTWQGMCSFMMRLAAFRDAIREIDELLQPLSGWTLTSKFSEGSDVTSDPLVSHVAIFGCQVGLFEVWKSLGVSPDIVVGQSVGEVASAYTSGSIDLRSAVRVIYYRSKFLSEVKEGTMAVVKNVDTNEVEKLCATTGGKLCIAVYISPTSCTISGDKKSISMVRDKLKNGLGKQGGVLIDLDVPCAYHSSHVEHAAKQATQMLKHLTSGKNNVPIVSTVSSREEEHQTFAQASYWEKNTRCAVKFGDAIMLASAKSESGQNIFVEIGPAPVLGAHVKSLFPNDSNKIVLPSMRKKSEAATLCKTICTLYELGLNINWEQIVSRSANVADIPRYVFRPLNVPYPTRQVMEITTTRTRNDGQDHMYVHLDKGASKDRTTFHIEVNETTTRFAFDHIVRGEVLLPGAFYADIGFEAAQSIIDIPHREAVVSLEFTKPAKIRHSTQNKLHVDLVSESDTEEVQFFVKQGDNLVCIGNVEAKQDGNTFTVNGKRDVESLRLSMLENRSQSINSKETLYKKLSEMGFDYGPCFQTLTACLAKEGQCLTTFDISEEVFKDIGRTVIHPCLLDGMFQSTFFATDEKTTVILRQESLLLMPVAVQGLTVHEKPQTLTVYAHAKMTNSTFLPNVVKLHYDIVLLNIDGTVIADVRNYTTYCRRNTTFTPDELQYKLSWLPVSLATGSQVAPKTLVFNTHGPRERVFGIGGDNTAVCDLSTDHLTEDRLQLVVEGTMKGTWGSVDDVDAMVLYFGCNETEMDLTQQAIGRSYARVKHNCMLLTWVLRYLINRKQTPLFIVTENTQVTHEADMERVYLSSGSEVWGLVRNVLIEFVHDKVVLVDLQPSLEEAQSTFSNFLSSAVQSIDSTQTEYIIAGDKVLGGTFSKTAVTDIIPQLRVGMGQSLACNGIIMSEQEDSIVRPFVVPIQDGHIVSEVQTGFEEVEVTSVSLHEESIFPTTTPKSVPSTVDGTLHECYPIQAVEYTGFGTSSKAKQLHTRCGNKYLSENEINTHDRWQVAAVYPQVLTTRMAVPRDCLVNLRKLPFYRSNMLTNAILYWNIAKVVPKGSSVAIQSGAPHDGYDWLLEKMLQTNASAKMVERTQTHSTDVLVVIGGYDERNLEALHNVNAIICLKYTIPDKIQKHLQENRDIKITDIDKRDVFQRSSIRQTLKKVVPWLARYLSPEMSENIDNTSESSNTEVCLSKDGRRMVPLKVPLDKLFMKQDVFVITGGLTGLGWQTTLMLVERGVGTVATLSRREIDEETKKMVVETEKKYGCNIRCFQGDVCELQSVMTMMNKLTRDYGCSRIRGVIHGAGVLDSQLIVNMDETQLDRVMAPKVLGVMNLHAATAHLHLDFFIMQSSIASIVGMPGQGSYGAANMFLDNFARWRRSKGLAAQSINWGALEVGMAAQKRFMTNLVKRGYNRLTVEETRGCFFHAIMQNSTSMVYANLDWSNIARDMSSPPMARVAVSMKSVLRRKNVAQMPQEDHADKYTISIEALKQSDDTARRKAVEMYTENIARKTIGADVGMLNMTSTFAELGMESLAAVMFSNIVYQETGCRIEQATLFEKTIGAVVAEVCSNIAPR